MFEFLRRRRLRKWLQAFVETEGGNIRNPRQGMCHNIRIDLGDGCRWLFRQLYNQWPEKSYSKLYPIHDKLTTHWDLTDGEVRTLEPYEQYRVGGLYEGRQLELRIRLAKWILCNKLL